MKITINPFSSYIKWHLDYVSPKILDYLFGDPAPNSPELQDTVATSSSTGGTLFDTSFSFDPATKTGQSSVGMTDLGQQIGDQFMGQSTAAINDYQNFNEMEYAAQYQDYINKLMGNQAHQSQNRLFDRVGAMTGGLAVTSGGRNLLAQGAALSDQNLWQQTSQNLANAYARGNTLFGRINPALQNTANYYGQGENVANRDYTQWQGMSTAINKNTQQEYQKQMQDYADNQSFWQDIEGFGIDLLTGGYNSFVDSGGFGDLFGGGGSSGGTQVPQQVYV